MSPDAALSPRRATHLFLLRQNKVNQKKATRSLGSFWGQSPNSPSLWLALAGAMLRIAAKLVSDPNNSPCGARAKRGLARTRCAQTIASPFPLNAPLLSSARTGGARMQIRGASSPLLAPDDATFLIAGYAGIYWAISLNAIQTASSNSSFTNAVAIRIKDKLHRVSRKFYNWTNVQYIQPQPNPHAALGGI